MARILVVDDEYAVRLPLRRVLEREGHEVTKLSTAMRRFSCSERHLSTWFSSTF